MKSLIAVLLACALAASVVSAANAGAERSPRVVATNTAYRSPATSVRLSPVSAAWVRVLGPMQYMTAAVSVGCKRGILERTAPAVLLHQLLPGETHRIRLPLRGGSCDITAAVVGKGRITVQIIA